MDPKLAKLAKALEALRTTVDNSTFTNNSFDQQHGWNQIHLDKNDIYDYLNNFISKLESYGETEITSELDSIINRHIQNIDRLNTTAKSYFNDDASHLIHFIPSMLLTLNTINYDIDYELFSFENLQDKKLVPKSLAARLRGMNNKLDSLNESSESLKGKIKVINDAHEAAESLPTDLASLQDAKRELNTLIKNANHELSESLKSIVTLKEETTNLKNKAKEAADEVISLKNKSKISSEEAEKLVEKCDEALQITTTKGLAAGFDQRAEELKKSIWVWIIGLLIALVSGAYIGAERVESFTQVLNEQLTAGQAILHTVMSVFSMGGPLWLAWISTQQINQRFKLSEDYSYKSTVAKSFIGFKKFAERFEPETEERLFNSTLDRFDEMPLRLIQGKDYNSPWHEFTDSESFKIAIAAFPALAKDAINFANKTSLKTKRTKRNADTSNKPEDPTEGVASKE